MTYKELSKHKNIVATKEAGLVSMPGCATPSEMTKAYKLGADLIKLFPASMVTMKTIKNMKIKSGFILRDVGGKTKDELVDLINVAR